MGVGQGGPEEAVPGGSLLGMSEVGVSTSRGGRRAHHARATLKDSCSWWARGLGVQWVSPGWLLEHLDHIPTMPLR